MILPNATRFAAVQAARALEGSLALPGDGDDVAMLGSFGIGTFPADGDNARALFSAADGRMYSEKHRRKAESLATLAGAARKLFVRAVRAMRAETSVDGILQNMADACREEFALLACVIDLPTGEARPPVRAVAADREFADAEELALAPNLVELTKRLPADAWVIDTPILDEHGQGGVIVLPGIPSRSFRPDAPVVVAFADLIQAVVANARAHQDAARAGRERDIHIELARELAGAGTLDERLANVTALVSSFIGALSVSIEGLPTHQAPRPPYNLISGASDAFLTE